MCVHLIILIHFLCSFFTPPNSLAFANEPWRRNESTCCWIFWWRSNWYPKTIVVVVSTHGFAGHWGRWTIRKGATPPHNRPRSSLHPHRHRTPEWLNKWIPPYRHWSTPWTGRKVRGNGHWHESNQCTAIVETRVWMEHTSICYDRPCSHWSCRSLEN